MVTRIECMRIENLDLEKIKNERPTHCIAELKYVLLNDPQSFLPGLGIENYYTGIGIILLTIVIANKQPEFRNIQFSEVRGIDLDPETELDYFITYASDYISELQQELDATTDKASKEAIELMTSLRKASDKLKDANKLLPKENKRKGDKQYTLTYPLSTVLPYDTTDDNVLRATIEKFIRHNDVISTKSKKEIKNFDDVLELKRNSGHLTDFSNKITQSINKQFFYFIGANPSKQSALFYLRDKNNALAQAIHNFYQLTEGEKNNDETRFIKDWMKVFEVGEDFSINMQAGEAYEFKVFEKDSKTAISLSDKGMGSLQAMTLILKIASLIRLNKKNKKFITVLVEEPELNLHPALQSKLTDFFHEVNIKYGFNFLVETHSEYMIRKSQVLTNSQEYGDLHSLNPSPFSVYYFPVDLKEPPYEMKYRKDGKFMNDFKPGFFDVSSNLAFDIL